MYVRQPYIEYHDDTVDILITVTPAEGGQTCPGNPPTPSTVTLTQPLASRTTRSPPDEVRYQLALRRYGREVADQYYEVAPGSVTSQPRR